MTHSLPAIPYLPDPPAKMDAEAFTEHGPERGAAFYLTALTYGHYLWQRGLVARAILKLDRALGADLTGNEPVLQKWPLPYEAMEWMLRHAPPEVFIGNPRVHFQHLADRMNEPRREQRRWRMWACWAICRRVLPHLPGDPKHIVEEPSSAEIARELMNRGLPGEVEIWQRAMQSALRGPLNLKN